MIGNDRLRSITRHMVSDIDRFDGRPAALDDLSFSLKANLALLDQAGADTAWIEELRALRNQVEVVNAFFIESRRLDLTDEERREIGEILDEMRQALVEH
jgi:hypothetical protein